MARRPAVPVAQLRDVLVTGAGRGLGAAATTRLADGGWRVFAGDLDPPEQRDGVVPLQLDVTDTGSVDAALAAVRAQSSGLGGVVHFAGILRVGSLVELPTEVLEQVLAVNVLGVQRVTRAALPLLRTGGGRVVVISSETGVQTAAPFNGPYAISKHAVEAYADALRRELVHLGIPVVKIRPGPFRTEMVGGGSDQFRVAAEQSALFGDELRGFAARMPTELAKAHDPEELALLVEQVLSADSPRPAYLLHADRTRMLLERLPVRVQDKLLELAVRRFARSGRRERRR